LRRAVVLLAVLGVTASGQWLEKSTRVGRLPTAIVSCYPWVYCANSGDSTLSAIDREKCEVYATIVVGDEPSLLAADPYQYEVYCACRRGRSVCIVSSESNTVVATFPVEYAPSAILQIRYPERRLFVAGYNTSRCNSTVTVIDLERREVAAELSVPGEVASILYSGSSADRLYCSDPVGACVWVVSVPGESLVGSIPAGAGASAMTLTERGRLYCANRWDGTVTVIDRTADTVLAVLPVGKEPISLLYARELSLGMVYCANLGSDYVSVIDDYYVGVCDSLTTGAGPCFCHYDWMWYKLYVLNFRAWTVTVHDVWSGELLVTLEVPAGPVAAAHVEWNWLNRLFVACGESDSVAVVADSIQIVGAEDGGPSAGRPQSATLVRGMLKIPGGRDAELVDINGRHVLFLQPGSNDIRHLAPGVYFVRSAESGKRSAVQKVVIQR